MNRRTCSAEAWHSLEGRFIALWTSGGVVYALFAEQLASLAMVDGTYPALSSRFPGAAWFERVAHDLNGDIATGVDLPAAIEQLRGADGKGAWPEFPPAAEEGVHQLAVGPVFGEITQPAHYRFSLLGEQVLRLQLRHGYAHRGILPLMRGKSPRLAARFAARVAGDATVAHALAFAQAAETIWAQPAPPRALALRAVMAELERIANHAGDLAVILELAGAAALASRFGWHRESFSFAAGAAFGHRLMMDMVIPGGVAGDLAAGGAEAILRSISAWEAEQPALLRLVRDYPGLRDRLAGIGIIPPALLALFQPGGCAARACGEDTDARKHPGYAPYSDFQPASAAGGDVAARVDIRLSEIAASARLIRHFLAALPEGPVAASPGANSGEACGVAESFRGPVWYWMRLEAGMIADIFLADASTLLWPLLPEAARSASLADVPLVERSFNPSQPGIDL